MEILPTHAGNEQKEVTTVEEQEDQILQAESISHSPHVVRLPGFITDEEIGLGDVVKHITSSFGIQPCGGCEGRAARLNQWIVFRGRHSQ